MFNFLGIGKSKRKQNLLVLTEDGRIVEESLPVLKGYVVSEKTVEAWELDPSSCIPERGTNNLYQVVTERDWAPMSLDGHGQNLKKRQKNILSQIAQENASAARDKIQKKSYRNKQAEALQLLVIVLGITVAIVVIFGLFLSGKLSLPWSNGGGGILGTIGLLAMAKDKKQTKEETNTMVLDPDKGFALERVDEPKGRLWHYGKQLVYLMKRVNNELLPVEIPAEIGEPPEKLYRALFWEKEADILFTLRSPLLEKLKLIGMYVLIGVLLFFIFLVFSSL